MAPEFFGRKTTPVDRRSSQVFAGSTGNGLRSNPAPQYRPGAGSSGRFPWVARAGGHLKWLVLAKASKTPAPGDRLNPPDPNILTCLRRMVAEERIRNIGTSTKRRRHRSCAISDLRGPVVAMDSLLQQGAILSNRSRLFLRMIAPWPFRLDQSCLGHGRARKGRASDGPGAGRPRMRLTAGADSSPTRSAACRLSPAANQYFGSRRRALCICVDLRAFPASSPPSSQSCALALTTGWPAPTTPFA